MRRGKVTTQLSITDTDLSRGIANTGAYCPVAIAFKRQGIKTWVGRTTTIFFKNGTQVATVRHTRSMRRFILKFDTTPAAAKPCVLKVRVPIRCRVVE